MTFVQAPFRRIAASPHSVAWLLGLIAALVSAIPLLGFFLGPVMAILGGIVIGSRYARTMEFVGRVASSSALGGCILGIGLVVGTVVFWETEVIFIPSNIGLDAASLIGVALFYGLLWFAICVGVSALSGWISGRNSMPLPVLPSLYDL
jgi:hypothetical protein